MVVRIYTVNKSNNIGLTDGVNNNRLDIHPNEKTNLGAAFNYKWIGLGAAFDLPGMNTDDSIFGKTKSLDFQLNIYTRKFVADAYFSQYKGFHIFNPQKYFPDWDSVHYPLRPDVSTFATGANLIFIYNSRKFSYRGVFVQNELQLKSAGSFLYGLYSNIHFMNSGKESIIPAEIDSFFHYKLHVTSTGYSNLGLMAGYGYSLVIKKALYFQLSFMLGLGMQQRNLYYESPDLNSDIFTAGGKVNLRFAIGYNGKKNFIGISGVSDLFTSESQDKSYKLEFSQGNVKFFLGHKFNLGKKRN